MNSTGNDCDDSHRPRLSLKESSAAAQRRAMNVRRHELSSQIRKAKRSHVVQLKRRLSVVNNVMQGDSSTLDMTTEFDAHELSTLSAANTNEIPYKNITEGQGETENSLNSSISTAIQVKLYDVASAFLKATQSASTAQQAHIILRTFQRVLAKAPTPTVVASLSSFFSTNATTDAYPSENASRAYLLCQALAHILVSENIDITTRLEAVKVLTNLAAMDSFKDASSSNNSLGGGGAGSDEWDYYNGQQMMNRTNWCDVILDSKADSALTQVLTSFVSMASPPIETLVILGTTQSALDLCEQCCWALGNLAGDSQTARDTIKTRGALASILGTLRLAFQLAGFSSLRALALCRNAAWALSNLARGTLSSALPFLAITSLDGQAQMYNSTAWLLTQQDFFFYLLCTEQFATQTFTQTSSVEQDVNSEHPTNDRYFMV